MQKKAILFYFKLQYLGDPFDSADQYQYLSNPDTWYWYNITKRKRVTRLDTLALKRQRYVGYKRTGEIYEFLLCGKRLQP